MILKVKLTKRAANKLDKLLTFLTEEWSLKVKQEFIQKLDKSISIIRNKPQSFPKSQIVQGVHK